MPAVGPEATHAAGIGVFDWLLVPHVVAVKLLPGAAAILTHDATPVGPVVLLTQVVDVKVFPALAADAVQVNTGTLLVTIGAGQVLEVNELPALAAVAVQLTTGTLVVTIGAGQVVVV